MINMKTKSLLNRYDIICLTETWWDDASKKKAGKTPKGYREIQHNRNQKHRKGKGNSGGILLLYEVILHTFIKGVNQSDQNILWLKIDRNMMG